MTLATDTTGATIFRWPNEGDEFYGFGMNANTLNYNVPSGNIYKFYCEGTVVIQVLLMVVCSRMHMALPLYTLSIKVHILRYSELAGVAQ